jgi:glycogen debranching enzyme
VVECVEQRLLTPIGLRSLAPDESGYAPLYEGDSSTRDAVYHQGTVWPWLMGSSWTHGCTFGETRKPLASRLDRG